MGISPRSNLSPIKSISTVAVISSSLNLYQPFHQCSKSKNRSRSVSISEKRRSYLSQIAVVGFNNSKFCTNQAPSNVPSFKSANKRVSHTPPERPPINCMGLPSSLLLDQ